MYPLGYDFVQKNPILEIDPPMLHLKGVDFLQYFYYAGICCIAMKDFISALENFSQVIATPAQSVSAIVIQAYKKALLVSLIQYGRAYEIPNHASQVVLQLEKKSDKSVYDEISKAFLDSDSDRTKLEEVIAKSSEVLKKDLNLGLANQVLDAFTRHRIRGLTNTYITLSSADIAAATGLENGQVAEFWLRQMVAFGEINLGIDRESNMVRFEDLNSAIDDSVIIARLENSICETIGLADKVTKL